MKSIRKIGKLSCAIAAVVVTVGLATATIAQQGGHDGPPRHHESKDYRSGPGGQGGPGGGKHQRGPSQMRGGPGGPGGHVEESEQTYIGVVAMPTSPTVQAQLGLDKGVGLTVHHVADDSPAEAAGLQRHDILHKLGDQILVNIEQLSTLVRSKAEGDVVSLTVIRSGEPKTVEVTLGRKMMPSQGRPMFMVPGGAEGMPMHWMPPMPGRGGPMHHMQGNERPQQRGSHDRPRRSADAGPPPFPGGSADEFSDEQWQSQMQQHQQHMRQLQERLSQRAESGELATEPLNDQINQMRALVEKLEQRIAENESENQQPVAQMTATMRDDDHVITVTITDDTRVLDATDAKGNLVFDGPITTDEQRAEIPKDILAKVERLERTISMSAEQANSN